MTVVESLRRRAYEHELNARSFEEREEIDLAAAHGAIAITLYEVAEALEEDEEEDDGA